MNSTSLFAKLLALYRGTAAFGCDHLAAQVARALCFAILIISTSASAQDASPSYTLIASIGGGAAGSANGEFRGPAWVAIDPTNRNIIVTDQDNNRIQTFTWYGKFLTAFGAGGADNGQFNAPGGVAIDPVSQNIVSADIFNHRVQIFNSSGAYLSQFGTAGSANGEFTFANCVAIDPTSHNIAVTDNNRVQVFSSAGVYLGQFGSNGVGNGQFNGDSAVGLAIDATSHNIVVADYYNNRVQIFNSLGVFRSAFGGGGSGHGQFASPSGVAIDPSNHNIFVSDRNNHRIQIFDSTGAYIGQFGSFGAGPGQFNQPVGIAIDPISLYLVVADWGNQRVQVFASSRVDVPPITPQVGLWWNPAESGTGYALGYKHEVLVVTVYSYTTAGEPLWYLASGRVTNNIFTATLDKYQHGQCISCAYQPAAINGNDGNISIRFTSPTTATMTLPGGRNVPIVPQAF